VNWFFSTPEIAGRWVQKARGDPCGDLQETSMQTQKSPVMRGFNAMFGPNGIDHWRRGRLSNIVRQGA
jgi:hypothetical protein